MVVVAVYNAFIIPIQQCYNPVFLKKTKFVVIDYIVDFIFVTDICLSFFTSVIDNKGKESFDSRLIYLKYTGTTKFYVDFLSLFGISILTEQNRVFKFFGALKIFRVLRVN